MALYTFRVLTTNMAHHGMLNSFKSQSGVEALT